MKKIATTLVVFVCQKQKSAKQKQQQESRGLFSTENKTFDFHSSFATNWWIYYT